MKVRGLGYSHPQSWGSGRAQGRPRLETLLRKPHEEENTSPAISSQRGFETDADVSPQKGPAFSLSEQTET